MIKRSSSGAVDTDPWSRASRLDGVARLGESLGGQTAKAAGRAGDEYDLAHRGFPCGLGAHQEERAQLCCGSDDSAVGAQRLAVDPGAVGAGEEGDGGGDIRRLAEALQRSELGEAVDDLLRLAMHEKG